MACIKRPVLHNSPIKHLNGNQAWKKSDLDKVKLFAQHLKTSFNHLKRKAVSSRMSWNENFTLNYVGKKMSNLKLKKRPGYDLITGCLVKNVSLKSLIKLTSTMNVCLKFKYVPMHWTISEIKMIPKLGKNPNEVKSYRPISSRNRKAIWEIIFQTPKQIMEYKPPSYQFGFREKHSLIAQTHRLVYTIEEAIECNQAYSTIFLDVAQTFDLHR